MAATKVTATETSDGNRNERLLHELYTYICMPIAPKIRHRDTDIDIDTVTAIDIDTDTGANVDADTDTDIDTDLRSNEGTGWRRLIGSSNLQIIFHKRATKYRSLLQKMTYEDKGSYESSPPCSRKRRERA